MKLNDIENLFSHFLRRHCDSSSLLLGLSGGPDSMALFHLLIAHKREFQVAHVDHRWRPESGEEARYLAALCEKYAIPFHLQELSAEKGRSNLEERGRRQRLAFFREICKKHQLQGVMLAHHADDQAETVLKRVFEGASLPKLKGLKAKSFVEGIFLLRPFLHTSKKEILFWLDRHNISYFQDPTNNDPRFLRGRCRTELFPILTKSFGKTISTSLCRLGKQAEELEEFLIFFLEPYRRAKIAHEEGVTLDLTPQWPEMPFLWKAILRDLFDQEGMCLSHSTLESVISHLQKRSKNKELRIGKSKVILNQGVIHIKKEKYSK
ncbi:MAG: tRNA lysidine(34) synthetase TilS [Chlamydiales bacterium]